MQLPKQEEPSFAQIALLWVVDSGCGSLAAPRVPSSGSEIVSYLLHLGQSAGVMN